MQRPKRRVLVEIVRFAEMAKVRFRVSFGGGEDVALPLSRVFAYNFNVDFVSTNVAAWTVYISNDVKKKWALIAR